MKKIALILCMISLFSIVEARGPLVLSNDAWPPFIIEGEQQGTAEKIVCQALERSDWSCTVKVNDWELVLDEARSGAIAGIAASWRDAERETYLLFSEPYLTNRIVPVVNSNKPVVIDSIADLSGLRVGLVSDYAYGDEIMGMAAGFEVINAKNSLEALNLLRSGKIDAALIDELVARNELENPGMENLMVTDTVLAFRDLHFAVSRQHPQAEAIIADFHNAYKLMLADGTVNEILKVDWLATDFGQPGRMSVVLRSGVSLDDLSPPSNDGEVYALEGSEFDITRERNLDPSRVNYQVEGNSYSSLQSALDDVFGKDSVCKHKNFTSQFDCSDIFKK